MFPLPPESTESTKSADESLVQMYAKDNFYQSVSFFPMTFACVTTINERGTTSIGPHSLIFPFDISEAHSMMLISRASSNTATNLRRVGKCALNFIEFDKDWLKAVVDLGYPGQTPEEKMEDVPFELMKTPNAEFKDDPDFPMIMKDAFQIFECVVDGTFKYEPEREAAAPLVENFFSLTIKSVLMKESFKKKLDSREEFPDMPISYGFRGGNEFWFTRHSAPFFFPVPRDKGPDHASILYMANKLDADVRFNEEACKALTGVPKAFIEVVLEGIIKEAKKQGVSMVDADFIEAVEEIRQS
jgi:flavin reductase (DIM6/NTAB) family NADH-FMN oxidoreductase RutF